MKIVVTLDDIRAYAEVDYIIHHMNQRYIDMLPFKLVNFFDKFKDPEWEVNVDPKKPLQSQGLMKYALEIVAVLHVKYWCSSEKRRQELLKMMQENQNRSDEALRAKYNVENVFATQNITSVTTANDLIDITDDPVTAEVTDFSQPRKATVIESVPTPPSEEAPAPEEEKPEEIEMPKDFRQPIDGDVTTADIVNSSASIDNLPIETEKEKKLSFFQKILNLFKFKK